MSEKWNTQGRNAADTLRLGANPIVDMGCVAQRQIWVKRSTELPTVLLMLLAAFWLGGCKDSSSLPAPIAAKIAQAKGIITGERFPEEDVEELLANHSFATLTEGAEQGNPKAQYAVAYAYVFGINIPKNFATGRKWALRAANQGVAPAQLLMGKYWQSVESKREGPIFELNTSELNFIRNYAWHSLAAAAGLPTARAQVDRLDGAELLSAWIERAQQVASEWRPCRDRTCWDHDLDVGPSIECKDRPDH